MKRFLSFSFFNASFSLINASFSLIIEGAAYTIPSNAKSFPDLSPPSSVMGDMKKSKSIQHGYHASSIGGYIAKSAGDI